MNKKVLTALTVAGIATAAMATDVSADTYTVKSGDTLSSIAANHNTTVDRILNVNKIADANMIFVGEQFELDDQAAASTQSVTPASSAVATQQSAATSVASVAPAASQATSQATTSSSAATTTQTSTSATSGSTYDQFIAAGGTSALWTSVVMPESGGNVNASNGQYHGLGQTNQSWGYGSVASQTQGMLNYATSRYGSVENAIAFRAANGWW
ncbi:LysM peptidoglycan-binding domain-containing protein [Weissella paramesenteroides]|uniref:LysM peptidoglycan-binding domain-containing protein n=1 Tax=Weissella paramesenteroides TaxID=1249 RepID=UPI003F742C7B